VPLDGVLCLCLEKASVVRCDVCRSGNNATTNRLRAIACLLSLGPASIEVLRAEAKRRDVSQGDVIESLLELIPEPVMPVEQPRNPLHDDRLIDTIGTVQSELRGDVELGAMDRYHQAPVESCCWHCATTSTRP
jgi:hypothetical protein